MTSALTHSGLYRLTLADGARRVVWALSRGSLVPRQGAAAWDFDATETKPDERRFKWSDLVDSLKRWVDTYQPPILIQHGEIEHLRGETLADPVRAEARSYGSVVDVQEVSEASAREQGVEQTGDAVYMTVEFSDDIIGDVDAGHFPFVSPGLRAGYEDDTGATWPIVLRELTLTADPRQKTKQVSIPAAASLGALLLSDTYSEATSMEDETKTEDPIVALAAVVETLRAECAEMRARLDKMAPLEDAVDPEVEEDEAALSDTPTTIALRKRVAELERAAAVAVAERDVDALLSDREIAPDARRHLVALHSAGSADAVRAIIAAAPKRRAGSPALKTAPVTGTGSISLSDTGTREERARELVRTKAAPDITAAWNMVSAQPA